MSDESFEVSENLQKGVDEAFKIGAKWLEEQDTLLFIYFSQAGKPALGLMEGCQTQEDVLARVRKWAKLEATTEWFVQMSVGNVDGEEGINALIAHCAERGATEAFVLCQRLESNEQGRFAPSEGIDFISRIPNDFF